MLKLRLLPFMGWRSHNWRMTNRFTVDDDAPVSGRRAIYFAGADSQSEAYSGECRTLGYACTVLGQIRSWRSTQRDKRFLIYLDFFDAPFIVTERELAICPSPETPPIRAQGEIVIAWHAEQDGDPQITGMFRTSPWVPRGTFLLRYGDTCEGRYRSTRNADGVESLTYEAPPGVALDEQLVVDALGQVTGQRQWRVLPFVD